MKRPTTHLEEALESWRDARLGFLAEARNIPAGQWDHRPTPEIKSTRELVVHVLEVAMMMTGELTRHDTDFRRMPWPKLLKKYAGAAYRAKKDRNKLLRLLRSQLNDAEKKFRAAGDFHMTQWIERFDGEKGTRLAWLHHGIAQEEYHRGQLCVYARLLGLEPALTKRIKSMT